MVAVFSVNTCIKRGLDGCMLTTMATSGDERENQAWPLTKGNSTFTALP